VSPPKRAQYIYHQDLILQAKIWAGVGPQRQHTFEVVNRIEKWNTIMSLKLYRIELKFDPEDNTRHQAISEIALQLARDFISSAMLLQDGAKKPQIAIITNDSFTGMEELKLPDAG
jgi:hypothetical protein